MGHTVLRGLISAFASVVFTCAAMAADLAPSSTGPAANTPSAGEYEYHLGAGDKVRIIVFGEDSLTGEFFVSSGGKIAFPLIGDIDASGLTIPDLQKAIAAKLADGYLKQPQVSAEVLNYRPFYILGEVMKPGEYPYTSGLTVLNAVATAEGFTYRADTRKVYIKRATSLGESEMPLTTATPVEPGDTIRIGERFF
jgi:protein involved in polysaccharide export with SLBB domain